MVRALLDCARGKQSTVDGKAGKFMPGDISYRTLTPKQGCVPSRKEEVDCEAEQSLAKKGFKGSRGQGARVTENAECEVLSPVEGWIGECGTVEVSE